MQPIRHSAVLVIAALLGLSVIGGVLAVPAFGEKTFSTARGNVIMTKGDLITVRLNEKGRTATIGDAVQVSYSVDGEVISVGTWRVSAVKDGGVLEAMPAEIKGKPNVGMDVLIFLQDKGEFAEERGKKNSHSIADRRLQPDSAVIYAEALRYYNGDGVVKDHNRAFGLFKQAGEMGHYLAQGFVGWMYQYGEGVEKDPITAVSWYRKAADQNNANAKNNLGIMYLNGEGVKQDYAMAHKLFLDTGSAGNKYGYWNLGRLYDYGWGVEKNLTTAFSYYLKAAEMGHLESQDRVCDSYMNGRGINKDYDRARVWCTKAADSGFAPSYNRLGLIYLNAFGVNRDYLQAQAFFLKAADGGEKLGYFNLGRMHDNGWGVPKNGQKALEYYTKFGDYLSAYRDGARKGYEEARQWLRERNMDW